LDKVAEVDLLHGIARFLLVPDHGEGIIHEAGAVLIQVHDFSLKLARTSARGR